jgi:predicted esterase
MKLMPAAVFVATLGLVPLTACTGEPVEPSEQRPEPSLTVSLPAILDQPATVEEAALIFAYDPSEALDVHVEAEVRLRDIIEVNLSFASPKGGRVPAFLWRPASEDGPRPGLVGMHGLPGDRHQMREAGVAYAEAGAILIGISGPTGRPDNNRRSVTFDPQQDYRDQIQLIVDLRRALDLLEARADVDPERIVFIGGSYGGAMGGLVAGVEHRFKAFLLMTGDGGVVTHMARGWDPESMAPERERWMEAMAPIEPIRFVGLAAPRPLFFMNSNFDRFVNREDALRYHAAASEPKQVRWYDYDHSLGTKALEDGAAWLQPIIEIDLDRFHFPPDLGDL